ncbi:MAG TPA: ornithine cyclodeaminase family protein [Vicinamibacteria bacterium]|nr:ornithine cyclodeaminase family protein [Vicinamibacteria bacterium]
MRLPVRILLEPEIRALIGPAEALREVREAFVRLGRGEATLPGVIGLDLPGGGEVHVKAAHLHGAPHFVVKEAGGFPGNAAHGLPSGSGVMLVFSAGTGRLEAVLFDNGYLTDLRTGAAGALAADLLANRSVAQVGILGTGTQARFQLEALLQVRRPQRAVVWSRSEGRAEAFAGEMQARFGFPVEAAGSVNRAVEGSEVLVTATSAREPLVREDWVFKGTHITAVGADAPGKSEVFARVLGKADKVVADSLAQCLRLGEIHHAVEAGFLDPARVHAELGEIVAGSKSGRERDDEITIVDLTGLGIQDAAVGGFVAEEAARRGIGRTIDT